MISSRWKEVADMMTIKEFASLCGCNTQTLRYYDKIDLFRALCKAVIFVLKLNVYRVQETEHPIWGCNYA